MSARHVLTLANETIRARAIRWIQGLPVGTKVEFKPPSRSLDQNAKLWACLTDVSRQVEWYGQKLTPEEWKDVFSASLRKAKVVPGLDTDMAAQNCGVIRIALEAGELTLHLFQALLLKGACIA